jgi:hypothetical protein
LPAPGVPADEFGKPSPAAGYFARLSKYRVAEARRLLRRAEPPHVRGHARTVRPWVEDRLPRRATPLHQCWPASNSAGVESAQRAGNREAARRGDPGRRRRHPLPQDAVQSSRVGARAARLSGHSQGRRPGWCVDWIGRHPPADAGVIEGVAVSASNGRHAVVSIWLRRQSAG